MVEFESRNAILLTGAGFTKNFGGFLAEEMWAQIFNNPLVQASSRLRNLLLENYDYESAYSTVVDNPQYSPEEQRAMAEAVELAYRHLDDATRSWVFRSDSPYPVNWYGLVRLLDLFSGRGRAKGLFFTLNEDLFMERQLGYRCSGAPPFPPDLTHVPERELHRHDFVTLPRDNAAARAESDFRSHAGIHYIKLHGSYGWRSSDGSHRLVIGKNKTELIEAEPLLKWYLACKIHERSQW